jgi:hypothetical protein
MTTDSHGVKRRYKHGYSRKYAERMEEIRRKEAEKKEKGKGAK